MRMPGRVKNTVDFLGSSFMCRQLMPGNAWSIAFWSG
jgi:hypothetical protein